MNTDHEELVRCMLNGMIYGEYAERHLLFSIGPWTTSQNEFAINKIDLIQYGSIQSLKKYFFSFCFPLFT